MNAIILAAGMGTRFKDITKNNHKALLPIGGIPNIERTINYLKEFGIKDITIVTGHMSNLFSYLENKYNCKLIYNKHYQRYNNIYSLYCALNDFNDTFVIDADVVLFNNLFIESKNSCYYTILRPQSGDLEWVPITNSEGRVCRIDITNKKMPSMLGISYWTAEACKRIKLEFEKYLDENILLNPKLYWDNIPIKLLDEIFVTTHIINSNAAGEMDTVENYNEICSRIINRPYIFDV